MKHVHTKFENFGEKNNKTNKKLGLYVRRVECGGWREKVSE